MVVLENWEYVTDSVELTIGDDGCDTLVHTVEPHSTYEFTSFGRSERMVLVHSNGVIYLGGESW